MNYKGDIVNIDCDTIVVMFCYHEKIGIKSLCCDVALSKKISNETGQAVTPEQVKAFREESNLTWHETEINANCAHKGEVSAKKYEQAWGDLSLDY